MKWREVNPGDVVFHNRIAKKVLAINIYDHDVTNVSDEREHVEVMFEDRDAPWWSYTDGWYSILGSKTVRKANRELTLKVHARSADIHGKEPQREATCDSATPTS